MLCVSLLTDKAMSQRDYTAQPYIDESEGFGDVAWRLTDNRILQVIKV